jgi:hypothetical protein
MMTSADGRTRVMLVVAIIEKPNPLHPQIIPATKTASAEKAMTKMSIIWIEMP